jgi:hypothetical protein
MVKVYRETRQGTLDSQTASRLVFMLTAIAKLIEGGDFEKRLDDIEQRLVTADTHDTGNQTRAH